MGWNQGTGIARVVIREAQALKPVEQRERLYAAMIEALDDCDWDWPPEACGIDPVFDRVLKRVHPSMFDESDLP